MCLILFIFLAEFQDWLFNTFSINCSGQLCLNSQTSKCNHSSAATGYQDNTSDHPSNRPVVPLNYGDTSAVMAAFEPSCHHNGLDTAISEGSHGPSQKLPKHEHGYYDKISDTQHRFSSVSHGGAAAAACSRCSQKNWRPLFLVIPLRLGLTEINPVYIQSLKVRLSLSWLLSAHSDWLYCSQILYLSSSFMTNLHCAFMRVIK